MTEREAKEYLEERGYGVLPPQVWRSDIEKRFLPLWERVKEFTLTSLERGFALFKAVEYVCRNRIPGDFVECGVYKGGSCMLLSLALQEFGEGERRIHLYDTFSGMTEPGEKDIIAWNGIPIAARIQEARSKGNGDYCRWEAGVEEVLKNLSLTGYAQENFVIHPGDVLHTLKEDLPDKISFLRLDTDWYSSTAFELKRLYPRVSGRGILFLDDYGHFLGAREAVEEYFTEQSYYPYLARVDYTARVLVKPA